MKLSVIIVSYNVKYHLEQCIRSVQKASEGIDADIWVVDNASSDGSVDYLQSIFPDVHFISNKVNVGFSRANNQAIRESQGEYVLILNPDTIVAEDTLKGCIDFLDSHPKVGATGVRMLNADGTFAPESRRGLPTPFTSFCKMIGLSTLFPQSRIFGRYYMKYLNADEANPIDVISGAFNMLRRKVLDEVGLLDEDFFMYGEDIDLSYRVLLGGWQNYYLPYYILHYKGESTQKSSFRYVHVFYNAMLIFFNKHFGKKYVLVGYIIRLAVVFRAMLDMIIRLLDRILPERKQPDIPYLRFDLRKTSVSEMLSVLRNQDVPKKCIRSLVETISYDGSMLIRHNEVVPIDNLKD
jgi:GT2 family glycosyltransferase